MLQYGYRGQKIQTSIERMFRIWKERRVYSNAFLKELEHLIEPAKATPVNEPAPDFKVLHHLVDNVCYNFVHSVAIASRCTVRVCQVS